MPHGRGVFFLSAAISLSAAPPTISNLDVRALQIGKVNTLTFTGTDLLPNPRLLTTARLARQTLKAGATPGRITLEVELAPGAQPGYENWWLVTDHGVSARGILATDSMAQKSFSEKVDSAPVALHGTLSGSQVREVTFHGTAGQEITCEMEAQRIESKVRPVLCLYGPGNTLVKMSLPMIALRGDTRLEARLPADGEYRLQVHDLLYAAASDWLFPAEDRPVVLRRSRLSVDGSARRDDGGRARRPRGREAHGAALVQTARNPRSRRRGPSPKAPVVRRRRCGSAISGNWWRSAPDPAPQALGSLPVAVNGRIDQPEEKDVYELTVEPETVVNIEVSAEALGSPIDAELELRDLKGARLAINDDSPDGPDPRLTYKVPKNVTKLLAVVRDVNGNSGPRCIYRLLATTKAQEHSAGFSLTMIEDSCTLEPGCPSVLKVEAARDGYDGPIDLAFDHLPEGVKVSGGALPAQATATLLTLSSDQPCPALITGLKGRGKEGGAQASFENAQLGQFQPWLVKDLALAGAAKSEIAFSAGWGSAVAGKNVPLGGKLSLPVKCVRPPGHDGPVRLTLLTSEARRFTNRVLDVNLNLRPEMAVLIEADKNAQTAFNGIATAEAALANARKAAAANKDESAADAVAKSVEAAQASLEKAKKAAAEAAAKAVNQAEFPIFVPADLPEIPHQIAFKAELLKRDRRTVEAVAYTPVQEIPVVNPLVVKLDEPAPIKIDPKTGATLELAGKVERLEGAVGDLALTVAGLPPGIAAPPAITVKNGATGFKFALKFPPTFKPGEYPGLKISATGKPFGPLLVRSRDASVTLKVLPPDPLPETSPPAHP